MQKKIISDAITNINLEYIEKASDYTVAKQYASLCGLNGVLLLPASAFVL